MDVSEKIASEELEQHRLWNLSNGKQGERLKRRGANLSGAYLSGANLNGAYLIGSNLSGAYLSGANLIGSNLIGSNLSGANLRGANLSGANLREVQGAFLIHGHNHIWVVVRHDEGLRIQAGCHWFTLSEAHEHWKGDAEHDRICRASLNAAEGMVKARGWLSAEEVPA